MNKNIFATHSVALMLLLSLIGCSGPIQHVKEEAKQQEIVELEKKKQRQETKEQQTAMSVDRVEKDSILVKKYSQPIMTNYNVVPPIIPPQSTRSEKYQSIDKNSVKQVATNPLSTFSIDVDTGSYTNIRRFISQGQLPPTDAVRVEEMLNYFNYHQAVPKHTNQPFSVNTEMMTAPWNKDRKLLKVALKGYEIPKDELNNANLVFLLDVSGSMNTPRKLPLLKRSLKMLTQQLDSDDRVSIVVYAGAAGVVLRPTAGNNYAAISHALDTLNAGGSTNGGQGIELAYSLAQQEFIKDGINRIILATDGDFNVGLNDIDQLKQLIADKRKQGITLTTLGFGQGNYNDHLMEQIADIGNGNYAYIDNINEARKVLVDQMSSTLHTIAHDVKIQVEFNPTQVSEYRLIGYENRSLASEDFNNDKVDAGDIGAGHQVTAIYELTLSDAHRKTIDDLKYQQNTANNKSTELAQIKLRYKLPKQQRSQLITKIITPQLLEKSPSQHFKFATAVAAFGQSLRGGKYLRDYTIDDIIILAQANKGIDNFGYRSEFIQMLRTAKSLASTQLTTKELSLNVQTIN